MEAELEKRIRNTQYIASAMEESFEDVRPLLETLVPAFAFMTREEIIEAATRLCAALDQEKLDSVAFRMKYEKDMAAKDRELELKDERLRQLEAENKAKAKELEAKDAVIASKDKELADKERELQDALNSEKTLKSDKFGSKSKRGIESNGKVAKGRDDNKEDFDGTGDSALQNEGDVNETSKESNGESIDLEDFKKTKGSGRPTKYKLADAAEKVLHKCDLSCIPAGAVMLNDGEPTYETVFHEVRTIRADIYEFYRYKTLETIIDEDGNEMKVWREHTMHFPMRGSVAESEKAVDKTHMEKGKLPDQVPGTHETPSMLASLMFEHYFCNVAMNRISKAYKEFGFKVKRSTLENLNTKVASMLKPLHSALLDEILCDDAVVFCDETWQRLHLRECTKKVYDWIVGNKKKKATAYVYDKGSRGRKVIAALFEGRNLKAVHTDGYNAYYFLQGIGIVHICCGAHLWRKLKEWYEATKNPDAKLLLLDLGELFLLDARLREADAPPEEVVRQRNSPHTLDIISRFNARVDLLLSKCNEIPKIGFRALNYAREISGRLFRWREDADYELDNNFAERAARNPACARKTQLHHCSHNGADNDCIIRSFVETCQLREVSIVGWFKSVFEAILQGRSDYPNLLPGVLPVS